ncbi:MAG: dienelactone hydrolase family protein [Pyrinomonadaceae bacterium]
MKQEYIALFDEYTHSNEMSRRVFLERLIKLTGGTAAAIAILPSLENNYVKAQTVSVNDKRLISKYVEYKGASGKVRAYFAAPAKVKKKLGAVMIIHENRGLNAHIEDVARRAALAGFIALAPDALSSFGGTPADSDKAREMIGKLDSEKTLEDFKAAVEFLKTYKGSNGRVGCAGFCWGGRMANLLAVNSPDMKAAVAYYGSQPNSDDVKRIKGAVMLHYAGLDTRINAGIAEYEKNLKANNIDYKLYVYDGVNHAFNNDTNEARYNEAAAKLAWKRTIEFWKEKLET